MEHYRWLTVTLQIGNVQVQCKFMRPCMAWGDLRNSSHLAFRMQEFFKRRGNSIMDLQKFRKTAEIVQKCGSDERGNMIRNWRKFGHVRLDFVAVPDRCN